jgi:phosphoribosylformimino-5-aminoimidazole carboxamide ribotide isomerase
METSNPASGFPMAHSRIVPVIDIMGGQVVRAVGGRRGEYRPVRSVLTDSTEPGAVARALVDAAAANWLYVADLDAIMHRLPDVRSVRAIVEAAGVPVECDGGFRTARDVAAYRHCGMGHIVGTETGQLSTLLELGAERCSLSVDLFDGELVGDRAAWGMTAADSVVGLVGRAYALGVRRVFLIDLSRVGTGSGTGTENLVAECTQSFHGLSVSCGGGIGSWTDIVRLRNAGATGVLVSSLLHDGKFSEGRRTWVE